MMDSAEPLSGWDDVEFMSIAPGLTANDIYGKLYGHLQAIFACFCHRVLETTVDFQLYNLDAMELSSHEEASSFARIEVRHGVSSPISQNTHAVIDGKHRRRLLPRHRKDSTSSWEIAAAPQPESACRIDNSIHQCRRRDALAGATWRHIR